MNTENFQESRFNPEEWMNRLFEFMKAVQYFAIDLIQAFKTLLQKSLLQVWKEIRSATSKLSPVDFFFAGITLSIGILGGIILIAGMGLLSYQSFIWLQSGVWNEYPMLTVFNFIFENTAIHQWLMNPESWIGIQKLLLWLLETTPVSLALMVPGFSIAVTAAGTFTLALIFRFYQLKNCLLYTSPSPRDRTRSRMPSSA